MAPIQATHVPHLDVLQQVMSRTVNNTCQSGVLQIVNPIQSE